MSFCKEFLKVLSSKYFDPSLAILNLFLAKKKVAKENSDLKQLDGWCLQIERLEWQVFFYKMFIKHIHQTYAHGRVPTLILNEPKCNLEFLNLLPNLLRLQFWVSIIKVGVVSITVTTLLFFMGAYNHYYLKKISKWVLLPVDINLLSTIRLSRTLILRLSFN